MVVTVADPGLGERVVTIEYTPFIFGSLYSQTPREEFDLLYHALSFDQKATSHDSVGAMLTEWDLDSVADTNFRILSGGFRKLVFVATQVETLSRNENVLAINLQHQLDPGRFRIIEHRLQAKGVNSVLWVDDDPNQLLRKTTIEPSPITLQEWLEYISCG